MSLGDGSVWDESNPQQSTLVNQGPLYETDFKVGVRSRMANEHVWPSSQSSTASAGQHNFVSFQGQTGQLVMPLVGTTTQAGMLFCLTNGTLTYQNSAGQTKTLITSSGGVDVIGAYYSSTGLLGEMLVGATSGGNLSILAPASTGGMYLVSTTANPGVVWSALNPTIINYGANTNTGTSATLPQLIVIFGQQASIAGNSSVTITGLPFSNSTSYSVLIGNLSTFNMTVSGKSATQFTLNNTHNDDVGGNGNGNWMAFGY